MRHSYFQSIFVCLLVVASQSAVAASWTTRGPMGGRVFVLEAAPSNPNVVYAGTNGGLIRSDDRGVSWPGPVLVNDSVTGLAIDPSDANIVYALSPSAVRKSADGGAHWQQLPLPSRVLPKSIVIDPRNPAVIFAASACAPYFKRASPEFHEASGVYKSSDGGTSWERATDSCVTALAIDPISPDTLYATLLYGTFARSDDSGRSWSPSPSPVPGGGIVVDPRNSQKRYGITSGRDSAYGTLLVSSDAGTTWPEVESIEITTQGVPRGEIRSNYTSLEIDPATGRLFLGTGTGAFRSGDGGVTWLPLEGTGIEPTDSLLFDSGTGALSIGSSSGLNRSDGYPWNDWRELGIGVAATSISRIAVDPSSPTALYALSENRLYRSRDLGTSWEPAAGLIPQVDSEPPTYALELAVDAEGDVYVIVYQAGATRDTLYKLDAGSSDWVALSPRTIFSSLGGVAADPRSPGVVYVGSYDSVAETRDGGATWELLSIGDDLTGGYFQSITIDPTNTSVLYAATARGIIKSTDRGRSWSLKTSDITTSNVPIAVSPVDPTVLYLKVVNAFARSTDAGESWTLFPQPTGGITALAADVRDRFTVYASTFDAEVVRSRDGGRSWRRVGEELFTAPVTSLAIDPLGKFLHAGTAGRGVWEIQIGRRHAARP